MLVSKGKGLPYVFVILPLDAIFFVLNIDIIRFSNDTISFKPIFNPFEKKDILNIRDVEKVIISPIVFGPKAGLSFILESGEYGTLSFLWKRERRLLVKELENRGIEVIDYSEY